MYNKPSISKSKDKIWTVNYPEINYKFLGEYYYALEKMESNPAVTEKNLKKIISKCGYGHFEAVLNLGSLYNELGREIEGNALITKAFIVAKEAFPPNFNPEIDQFDSMVVENQPILWAIFCYAYELIKETNYEGAAKELNFIVKVDRIDFQGVRYVLLNCLFHLNKFEEILLLEEKFKDDHSVNFLYGKFLALYQLGKIEKSLIQFKKAKKAFPLVAEELMKTKHSVIDDEFVDEIEKNDFDIIVGSKEEATEYWHSNHQFWKVAKGVREFMLKNSK